MSDHISVLQKETSFITETLSVGPCFDLRFWFKMIIVLDFLQQNQLLPTQAPFRCGSLLKYEFSTVDIMRFYIYFLPRIPIANWKSVQDNLSLGTENTNMFLHFALSTVIQLLSWEFIGNFIHARDRIQSSLLFHDWYSLIKTQLCIVLMDSLVLKLPCSDNCEKNINTVATVSLKMQ